MHPDSVRPNADAPDELTGTADPTRSGGADADPAGAGAVRAGLEGVIVAETALSRVDGDAGELLYRGRTIEEVAAGASFEEAAALLWGEPDVAAVCQALGRARVAAFAERARFFPLLDGEDGMAALAAGLAALPPACKATPADVTGAVGVLFAAWVRVRRGRPPIAPDGGAAHGADLHRAVAGEEHGKRARAFTRYLVTVMDHGLNASTFTARVIASTGADLAAAVSGALAALSGPLHGGAPGPVLDMLDAVAETGDARAWLAAELAAGRRIMGMGHRVYRVRDPRAAVLEAACAELEAAGPGGARLRLARQLEREAERALAARYPDRQLRANVEFYTALLLEAVGLPRSAFTPAFAAARVVGWCGHVLEQRRDGRIIRPKARYVGPDRWAPAG